MESTKTHGLARRRRSKLVAPRFPRNHHHHPNLYPYGEFQMENGTQKGKPISGWNYQTSDDPFPTSRTLEIAKRQQDLMKTVQAMPEFDFELTLKDLVVVDVTKMEKSDDGEGRRVVIVEEKTEGKRKRKVSSDDHLSLVKMILSVSLCGRKRGGSERAGSKVSPKNLPAVLSDGGKSSDEGSSLRRRGMTGCWSFYHKKTETSARED